MMARRSDQAESRFPERQASGLNSRPRGKGRDGIEARLPDVLNVGFGVNGGHILFFTIAYAAASVVLLKRNRDVHGWLAVVYMVMLLKTPVMSSQMRFLLPLLPVHVYWIRWLDEKGNFKAAIAFMLILQLILTRLALTWRVIL